MDSSELSFWGGESINHSRSKGHRVLADTFPNFVRDIIDVPIHLAISQDEYHALPPAEKNEVKKVPFFLPCSLKKAPNNEPTPRTNPSFVKLICVDVDECKEIPTNLDAMFPYNYVAYTTIGSTTQKPRFRVVVEANNIPTELYKSAVFFITNKMGMGEYWSGKKESIVVNQAMYRPVRFSPEPGKVVSNPIIGCRINGSPLSELDIPSGGEITDLCDEFFAQDSDVIQNITVPDVASMLEHLDPDCDRKDWITVICAMKHQFRSNDSASEAFSAFVHWSQKGGKFVSETDCRNQWLSAKPDPAKGIKSVTIRSVIYKSRKAGWVDDQLVLRLKTNFLNWLNQSNAELIISKVSEKIAHISTIGVSALLVDSLVQSTVNKLKELTGVRPSAAVMKKEIDKCKRKLEDVERASSNECPVWLREFVYISGIDCFVSKQTSQLVSPPAFRRRYNVNMMPIGDRGKAKPEMDADDFALNLCEIPRADKVVYNPKIEPGVVHTTSFGNYSAFNSYNPCFPPLNQKLAEEAGRIFTHHILTLVRSDSICKTLMDFLAHVIQYPGKKIRWIPIIHSIEGIGKSLFIDILAGVIGRGDVFTVNLASGFDKFNSWMAGNVLVAMEEIAATGKHREAIFDFLKVFIGNTTVPIRLMRCDLAEVENVSNAIAFTNRDEGLPLTQDSRRYYIVKSPLTLPERTKLENSGHFTKVEKLLLLNYSGGLRQYFLDYPIPEDFPVYGPAPETEARTQIMNASQGEDWELVNGMISDETEPLVCQDLIAVYVVTQQLRQLRTARQAASILRRMGYEPLCSGGQTVYCRIGGYRTAIMTNSKAFLGDPELAEKILRERYQVYLSGGI